MGITLLIVAITIRRAAGFERAGDLRPGGRVAAQED